MRHVWLKNILWEGRRSSPALMWALVLAPIVWLTVWLSTNVQTLGFRIAQYQPAGYQSNLAFDYTMGVLWWVIFAVAILLLGGESRTMLLVAWIGRFFVTLVAMPFYEHHYGLDAYIYFNIRLTGQSTVIPGRDFREDVWPSFISSDGNLFGSTYVYENTIRMITWVGLVTGPYYHAMKVGCAFVGLLGVWYFYRAAAVALGRPEPSLFYLLAFFPSIIFWSSILGKDPLLFFCLGLYAFGVARWLGEARVSGLWIVGLGLLVSFLMRPLLAALGAIAFLLAILLGRCRREQVGVTLLILSITVFVAVLLGSQFDTVLEETRGLDQRGIFVELAGIDAILEMARMKAEGVMQDTRGSSGSGVDLSELDSPEAVLYNLPLVMFSGLFRPLPFDITNLFTALAAAENSVFLFIAMVALFRIRWDNLRDPLVVWTAMFSLLWTSTHGMIVMANFGAGVRYKLPVWPFLLMVILLLAHPKGRALLASRRSGEPVAINQMPSGQG